MDTIHYSVFPENKGERIDVFLCREAEESLSRSMVQKLCGQGHVLVDGGVIGKSYRLKGTEQIVLHLPPPTPLEVVAQDIPLDIVYEDDQLLVVNKPKGMVVHPAAGNEDSTMVNALLFHCKGSLSGIGGVARPGIVHRIDKDTSGLLVVAKTDLAHTKLSEDVKLHGFTRLYHAVVYGGFKQDDGIVDAPIGRHSTDRKKMCITDKNAREAITHYRVYRRFEGFTYIICKLETGRTHQIRVHMQSIGHPVAGDPVYGPKKVITSLQGQCLHAHTLGFLHPVSGRYMEFSCEPPSCFTEFVQRQKSLESF